MPPKARAQRRPAEDDDEYNAMQRSEKRRKLEVELKTIDASNKKWASELSATHAELEAEYNERIQLANLKYRQGCYAAASTYADQARYMQVTAMFSREREDEEREERIKKRQSIQQELEQEIMREQEEKRLRAEKIKHDQEMIKLWSTKRANAQNVKNLADQVFQRGMGSSRVSRYHEAIVDFESAAKTYQSLIQEINELKRLKKTDDPIEIIGMRREDEVRRTLLTKNLAEIYYRWGLAVFQLGAYEEAIEIFKQAIENDERHDIYDHLGRTYVRQKQYLLAIENFQWSLSINARQPEISARLAFLHSDWKGFIRYCNHEESLTSEFQLMRAIALYQTKKYKDTIEILQEVILALEPDIQLPEKRSSLRLCYIFQAFSYEALGKITEKNKMLFAKNAKIRQIVPEEFNKNVFFSANNLHAIAFFECIRDLAIPGKDQAECFYQLGALYLENEGGIPLDTSMAKHYFEKALTIKPPEDFEKYLPLFQQVLETDMLYSFITENKSHAACMPAAVNLGCHFLTENNISDACKVFQYVIDMQEDALITDSLRALCDCIPTLGWNDTVEVYLFIEQNEVNPLFAEAAYTLGKYCTKDFDLYKIDYACNAFQMVINMKMIEEHYLEESINVLIACLETNDAQILKRIAAFMQVNREDGRCMALALALGDIYATGRSGRSYIAKNLPKAHEYYTWVIHKGNDALMASAFAAIEGCKSAVPTVKELQESLALYKAIVASGCRSGEAAYHIGLIYYEYGEMVNKQWSSKPNHQKALEEFTLAHEKGFAKATLSLAKMLYHGQGTNPNYQESLCLLLRVREHLPNNAELLFYLGLLYRFGGQKVVHSAKALEYPLQPVVSHASQRNIGIAANKYGNIVRIFNTKEVNGSSSSPMICIEAGKISLDMSSIVWQQTFYQENVANNPSIALDAENRWIAVLNAGNDLYYRVGYINSKGEPIHEAGNKYGVGVQPAVAINSECIVEVHKSENHDTVYYRIGHFKKDNSIDWGMDIFRSTKISENAIHPSVALSGNRVAVVWKCSYTGYTYCCVGFVNGNNLSLGTAFYLTGTKVVKPKVSFINETEFVIVGEEQDTGQLVQRRSTIDASGKDYSSPVTEVYDAGSSPSVTAYKGSLFAAHEFSHSPDATPQVCLKVFNV